MRKLAYLVLLATVVLAGCSTPRKVPVTILMPPVNDIQLAEVLNDPSQFKGAEVRWGGSILKAQPHDNYLRVEILQRSLQEDGEPLIEGGTSDGRFIAHIPQPYEADKFRRNRFISVYGELTETESRRISGQTEQELPVVRARDYYTWRVRYDYDHDPFHYGFYHRYPFYHPYYHGLYHPYSPRFYRPSRPPRYELHKQGNSNNEGNQLSEKQTNLQ